MLGIDLATIGCVVLAAMFLAAVVRLAVVSSELASAHGDVAAHKEIADRLKAEIGPLRKFHADTMAQRRRAAKKATEAIRASAARRREAKSSPPPKATKPAKKKSGRA